MLNEAVLLNKIRKRSEEEGLEDGSYSGLEGEVKKRFFEERKKRLGYSMRKGGNKTSVLISGSHAAGLVETRMNVSEEEADALNKKSDNSGLRYEISPEGTLLMGRHYLRASQREGKRGKSYKADTRVGEMCVELQDRLIRENPDAAPDLIVYELSQQFSEPNKVDASKKKEGMAVVDLGFYEKIGAENFRAYVFSKGVSAITSEDLLHLKSGKYTDIAPKEPDDEKKEALLEVSGIRNSLKESDSADFKGLVAALGVLRIHRSYYEDQEKLLYEGDFRRPVNLEVHTCFDALRKQEGVDMVIGTKLSSSVAESEMEMLLSLVLKKHGFNVNLSTLSNFPANISNREKESLENFLRLAIDCGLLGEAEQEEAQELSSLESSYLEIKAQEIFNRRLRRISDETKESEMRPIGRYLQSELGLKVSDLKNQGIESEEAALNKARNVFLRKVRGMSEGDLRLFALQNLVSCELGAKICKDRLRGGLMGLTSLWSKFDARENYLTDSRPQIDPAIFQIEIVQGIMSDPEKRRVVQAALGEFFKLVQSEEFDPKNALKKMLEEYF